MLQIKEDKMVEFVEKKAESLYKKYRPYMEALESKSPISKVKPITMFDYFALGKMLESYAEFEAMCEADGSIAQLGVIPKIAYDVIAVAYGTSPISLVASVQPIDEEQGIVYYKDVKAGNTIGNMTENDTIFAAYKAPKIPVGYAGQTVSEACGTTASGHYSYTFTLSYHPVRPYTVTINVATVTPISGTDDGANAPLGVGNITGVGITGTVNYATGVVSITLSSNPGDSKAITANYACNVEAKADVPAINYELMSKPVMAQVYALKTTFGMLKSYALKKRFGTVAEDEAAIDLTNAINTEVFGDMVAKMYAQAVGNTDWSKVTPAPEISFYEHKQTYKDALADAEAVLVANAGRGVISWIIAGSNHCAVMSTLPGFVKLYDGNSIAGAHLYGTLDGVPIIRVPVSALLPAAKAIIGYKGLSAFEAPAVYAPYMPLTVTTALPTANPLVSQKGAAVWAANDVLVSNFMTMLTMTGV